MHKQAHSPLHPIDTDCICKPRLHVQTTAVRCQSLTLRFWFFGMGVYYGTLANSYLSLSYVPRGGTALKAPRQNCAYVIDPAYPSGALNQGCPLQETSKVEGVISLAEHFLKPSYVEQSQDADKDSQSYRDTLLGYLKNSGISEQMEIRVDMISSRRVKHSSPSNLTMEEG